MKEQFGSIVRIADCVHSASQRMANVSQKTIALASNWRTRMGRHRSAARFCVNR
jgi:hypothetical protein